MNSRPRISYASPRMGGDGYDSLQAREIVS